MTHARKHPSIQEAEMLGWIVPSSRTPMMELELELELERGAHRFSFTGRKQWYKLTFKIDSQQCE